MTRLNFLNDEPWDETDERFQFRARSFGHELGADMLGASLRELLPGSPGGWLHMHYGVEEMFFVLSGTPTLRTGDGEECGPARVLEPNGRARANPRRLDEARSGRRRVSGAGIRLGRDPPSGTPSS